MLPNHSHFLSRTAAVAAFALLAAFGPPALAQAPATAAETTALKKQFEQKFPGAKIGGVIRTPYFGLFEVQLDDQIVYTDLKTTYVFVGNIYEGSTKRNLTEARQRQMNRVPVANLPLQLAFKRVKGNGARQLVVFSDADCPFCARLEQELKNVDNVTIWTFLFPIDQLHPDAARKSKIIWCSADKVKAWDEFFASGKLPDNAGECQNPVEATQSLGASLKINATPTLIFADGSVVPGAIPAAQMEAEFQQADAEMKKMAAAKK
ncbi:MAG: DsbC family protein [Betaproteobacteria bacterium]